MNDYPKVSIIVPVYNAEKQLVKCIDSILNQSYRNIEVILINDGSKDKSLSICNKYKTFDDRIKLIDKENQGVSAARNDGLNNATGKYILFCDSDDYVDPFWCEQLVNTISLEDADLGICGYYSFSDNGIINKTLYSDEGMNVYPKNIIIELRKCRMLSSVWNKIFKSDIIKDICLDFDIEKSFSEDKLFVYRYIMNMKGKISICNELLYYYKIDTKESLTKVHVSNSWSIMKQECYAYEELIENCEINLKCAEVDIANVWTYAVTNAINNSYAEEKFSKAQRMKIIHKILYSKEWKRWSKKSQYKNLYWMYKLFLRYKLSVMLFFFIDICKFLDK